MAIPVKCCKQSSVNGARFMVIPFGQSVPLKAGLDQATRRPFVTKRVTNKEGCIKRDACAMRVFFCKVNRIKVCSGEFASLGVGIPLSGSHPLVQREHGFPKAT